MKRYSDDHNPLTRMLLGAAAGAAGTLALIAITRANSKYTPQFKTPIRQDPGMFMVEQAERLLPCRTRQRVPEVVENIAAESLHFDYGMTFGAIYSMLRPRGGPIVRDGVVLGLGTWAVGYLGWLPATGLMRPVWQQKPTQIAGPILEHIIYGMVTVAAHSALNRAASTRPHDSSIATRTNRLEYSTQNEPQEITL